jgi:hypothetical protein
MAVSGPKDYGGKESTESAPKLPVSIGPIAQDVVRIGVRTHRLTEERALGHPVQVVCHVSRVAGRGGGGSPQSRWPPLSLNHHQRLGHLRETPDQQSEK